MLANLYASDLCGIAVWAWHYPVTAAIVATVGVVLAFGAVDGVRQGRRAR